MQKIHFFTGKGGTGKTTNAILFALENIKTNVILLCSLDPAHNLKDIFNNNFKHRNQNISGFEILEPSISGMLKKYLEKTENDLKSQHGYLSSFNLLEDLGIIKYSPGMEEYAIFYTFQNTLKKHINNNDILIFDMPPTALSIRFFALAKLSIIWLTKLIDLRLKIIEKKKIIDKVKGINFQDDKVLLNLLKQKQEYEKLQEILLQSKIHIVLNPEPISIKESNNLIKSLEEIGYSNIVIHLNKYVDKVPEAINELIKKYTIVKVSYIHNI